VVDVLFSIYTYLYVNNVTVRVLCSFIQPVSLFQTIS